MVNKKSYRKKPYRNKSYRKKSYRKKPYRKKSYRKKSRENFKKIYKNNLMRTQIGGSQAELPVFHRIGFELEACFDSERGNVIHKEGYCKVLEEYDGFHKIFGEKLNYFDALNDDSIQCPGHREYLGKDPERCGMELKLKDDNIFTYNGQEIYMDGMPITSRLMDEILLISSNAHDCLNGSCGFHVHISETDIPENRGLNNLNQRGGKLFLLRALALWCGIEGVSQSMQHAFIEKGYCRVEVKNHSLFLLRSLPLLKYGEFKSVYDLAMIDGLTNEKLLDYLMKVYKIYGYGGGRNHPFNIYDLTDLVSFDRMNTKKNYRQYIADMSGFANVDEMNKHIKLYEKDLSEKTGPKMEALLKILQGEGMISRTEEPSEFLWVSKRRSRYHLSESEKIEYDRLWGTTLRIEFRGHKDLMETIKGKYHQAVGYDIYEEARLAELDKLLDDPELKDAGMNKGGKYQTLVDERLRLVRNAEERKKKETLRREAVSIMIDRPPRLTPADVRLQALREELDAIASVKALKKRAREAGVVKEKLDDADDADDVRGVVIDLIVAQLETEPGTKPEPPRLRGHARAEHTRNLAKASRFFDYLMEYLEEINKFFTKAKTYDPLSTD